MRRLASLCGRHACGVVAVTATVPARFTATQAKEDAAKQPAAIDEAKLDELAAAYAQLTLKELSMLQRLIFKKMGHSDDFYEKALLRGLGGGGGAAQPMVMVPAVAAAAATPEAAAAAEGSEAAAGAAKPEKKKVEKHTFDVKLDAYKPDIKIKLIKELRTVTNLSIADAKKAVEKCPGLVATNLSKDDAEKLKGLFEKLGATVELL